MRPKDALEPTKQDGVVYKIPCECGKAYIGETGRAMQDRIKEHDSDIRLARTQTSAVSEHANEMRHLPIWKEVKFIDRYPHWYTRRVKEAIHIRLHRNIIYAFTHLRIYAFTQTSAVSEHANETRHLPIWKEVKFIDRYPHWYTRRVKEAIHIRLHRNNINRDSGIEIPGAWIPTIRKHNSRPTTKRTCERTTSNSRNNNEDRNAPIAANHPFYK